MMRNRSGSESRDQAPISCSERPHPTQSPDRGSIVQTFVQGELIVAIAAGV
jgi:hypothetical protein